MKNNFKRIMAMLLALALAVAFPLTASGAKNSKKDNAASAAPTAQAAPIQPLAAAVGATVYNVTSLAEWNVAIANAVSGDTITVASNVALTVESQTITVLPGVTLIVEAGVKLQLAKKDKVINNGTIILYGILAFAAQGGVNNALTNNGTIISVGVGHLEEAKTITDYGTMVQSEEYSIAYIGIDGYEQEDGAYPQKFFAALTSSAISGLAAKDGYEFLYWEASGGYTGTVNAGGVIPAKSANGNVALTAVWDEPEVFYPPEDLQAYIDAGGGDCYGGSYTASAAAPGSATTLFWVENNVSLSNANIKSEGKPYGIGLYLFGGAEKLNVALENVNIDARASSVLVYAGSFDVAVSGGTFKGRSGSGAQGAIFGIATSGNNVTVTGARLELSTAENSSAQFAAISLKAGTPAPTGNTLRFVDCTFVQNGKTLSDNDLRASTRFHKEGASNKIEIIRNGQTVRTI